MKRTSWFALPIFVLGFLLPSPVFAQTTPPPTASPAAAQATITGKVVNQNDPQKIGKDLDVMLHLFDATTQNSLNMLHGKTGADGSFEFQNVPLQEDLGYAVMAVYNGTSYVSEPQYAKEGKTNYTFEVPIYESTKDASQVRVDEVNVLFSFAQDGIEVKEVYTVSNMGKRTIQDTQALPDGKAAALKFNLPEGASYIFFQPEDSARWIQVPGGFADTAALVPGIRVSQFLVSYLIPSAQSSSYTYRAAYSTGKVNLVLPEGSGVTLKGAGLGAEKPTTTTSGAKVEVYSSEPLNADEALTAYFNGKPVLSSTKAAPSAPAEEPPASPVTNPVYFGGGLIGLALIGGGVFWWRKTKLEVPELMEDGFSEPTLDELIAQIAQLDQSHQEGSITDEDYQIARDNLMNRARAQMQQGVEPGISTGEAPQ